MSTMSNWTVTEADSPVLIHVPHAATVIPPAVRDEIVLSDDELVNELALMTDHHTDLIAESVAAMCPVNLFVNQLSRLVVDPERFPDEREVMRRVGMGAVYTKTSSGAPLRHGIGVDDTQLLESYFFPYAKAIEQQVDRVLATHGRCIIIDLHSFPQDPLPYELDQTALRPGVCLGSDHFHTPAWLSEVAEQSFGGIAEGVGWNTPFAGTYVPTKHYRRVPEVSSVMVELRRDLYLERGGSAGMTQVESFAQMIAAIVE